MARLDLAHVDVGSLVMLTGEAVRDAVTAAVHAAGFADVRPAHGYVFACLIDRVPTVTEIATTLGMTQQGASKLVVELEALGYVRRTPDPADSRARRVELTERGMDCVAAGRRSRAEVEALLVARIGKDGVAAMREALATLAVTLGVDGPIASRSVRIPDRER